MNKLISIFFMLLLICIFPSCQNSDIGFDGRIIVLSDSGISLDGKEVKDGDDVSISNDIIYYESGKSENYGEGTEADAHPNEEAGKHTVVTIKTPGKYMINGKLSAGQIAVDLGEDAKSDPEAVVTLVLNNADITCTVAPAVIFYNVYECDTAWVDFDNGKTEAYSSSTDIDTSAAGANIIIANGSVNNINGSYVAKIFKEGTEKKLHKYDGAFYSKMSMNIDGESGNTGVLNIIAENEGLDSELHLTINGGNINITAQNDGINTNEGNVSVTTVNGGNVHINAGLGEEGDGIDSNGHIVINGGSVYTTTNERSPDGGVDADGEIIINGGNVAAFGMSNGTVSSKSAQNYMELFFRSTVNKGSLVELKSPEGKVIFSSTPEKNISALIISSPELEKNAAYTLYVDGTMQEYSGNRGGFGGNFGGFGGRPNDELPEMPEGGFERPKGEFERPEGGFDRPENNFDPDDFESGEYPIGGSRPFQEFKPSGNTKPAQRPQGDKAPSENMGERPIGNRPDQFQGGELGEASSEFIITDTVHTFSGIANVSE